MSRFSPWSALLPIAAIVAPACGDDPVAFSEVVSLKLSGVKNGDLVNGTASEEKSVSSESGNPYGEFLKHAKEKLGGIEPSRIEVVGVTVQVHADSKNATRIEQVFADLEVFIANNATTIPVASHDNPTGSSLKMPLLEDVDYGGVTDSMLKGDFKMGARGSTVDPVPNDFDLKLTLDVRFEAYE